MKKILLSLMLMIFVMTAGAQFGVNAGLNISTLTGSGISSGKSKAGLHIGAFYQHHVVSGVAVQVEAAYSGEGVSYSSGSYSKDLLNYLNLAALFKYNFEKGFNVATGPQYGTLLSTKRKLRSSGSLDIKSILRKNNFSWAFNVGYDLPTDVGFYIRYNLGFSNIQKDVQGGELKTSTIQIGVRYNITKKSK